MKKTHMNMDDVSFLVLFEFRLTRTETPNTRLTNVSSRRVVHVDVDFTCFIFHCCLCRTRQSQIDYVDYVQFSTRRTNDGMYRKSIANVNILFQ